MSDFPHVVAPLTLRHRTLRCRINFGAHTTNMAEDGLPSDRHIAYYRERAIGGVGMIVVEPVPVHRTAVLTRGNFRPGDDSIVPHFRRLTDTCHEAADGSGGVVMIHQLYHVGQHGDADNSFAPNWSPSGLPSLHDADGSHAVTEAGWWSPKLPSPAPVSAPRSTGPLSPTTPECFLQPRPGAKHSGGGKHSDGNGS